VTTLAIPEPSTWAMMLLGFAGLGYAGYRNARKAAVANALPNRHCVCRPAQVRRTHPGWSNRTDVSD
jgi:hypothetical protein